jgi:glycosyltransferase involved in cell wall biosynthesis
MHLSVIVPTLNRIDTAQLIAARIFSLFADVQVEVIVVVPTAQPVPASSERLRFVADAGRGVYRAFTAGLKQARGQYIWFLGDDDYPLDAASALQAQLLAGRADLLVAPVLFSSGRIYRPTRSRLILQFLNWCQQGVIYRRELLLRHRFYRRLPVQADQYVNIQLRCDGGVSIRFWDTPICMFGVNGVSGRIQDLGYRALRRALAYRTLGCAQFLAFRLLLWVEPLVKKLVNIR